MPRLILLGAPGSGKGTQSAILSKEFSIPIIATGDMLRKAIAEETDIGLKAKDYMSKGELVPDEVVIGIALARLSQDDTSEGFLLDGFPRTVEQADALEQFLQEKSLALDAVIYLSVPQEELISRIAGRRLCRDCKKTYHMVNMPPKVEGVCDVCGGELYQRTDDSVETTQNRIQIYNETTKPLVNYYREKGLLLKIDGTIGVDNIESEIRESLNRA